MIDSAGREPAAARQARWVRRVVLTVLRALASTTALVGIYYLLPLDRTSIWGAVAMLGAGLLALIGLIVLQVRSVIKATYPAQRAVEALATSAPLFLLLFALSGAAMFLLVLATAACARLSPSHAAAERSGSIGTL